MQIIKFAQLLYEVTHMLVVDGAIFSKQVLLFLEGQFVIFRFILFAAEEILKKNYYSMVQSLQNIYFCGRFPMKNTEIVI